MRPPKLYTLINPLLNNVSLIPYYIKLNRLDNTLFSFFSYLFGATLAKSITIDNFLIAITISLISMNFIYSYNSWTDWEIDKINKPKRPIPSGKIKPKSAFIYSIILLFLSIIYPFLIFKSYFTLFLFLLLPILGILYSSKPFRLKQYLFPAVLITCSGLIIPIILGYFMNSTDFSNIPIFIIAFLALFSLIPLKDIEDVKGDTQNNCENWFSILGKSKLLIFSISGLILSFLMAISFDIDIPTKFFLSSYVIVPLTIILIFILFKKNLNQLYKTICFNTIILSFIYAIISLYLFTFFRVIMF